MRECPKALMRYLPAGHHLWFAEQQGALRQDMLLCHCGLGLKLDWQLVEGERRTVEPTEERWLEAINQCRMATHSIRTPCPPITLEGQELPVRELPPAVVELPKPAAPLEPSTTPGPGRPRKESAHAA